MKRVTIALIALLATTTGFGQRIIFQIGPSISKVSWKIDGSDYNPYSKTLIRNSVFVGAEYYEKKNFNLSSSIGILNVGGEGTHPIINISGEVVGDRYQIAKLSYLSINTLANLKHTIGEKFTPFICAGPHIDMLVHKNEDMNRLGDGLNKYNYGLILGGGIKLGLPDVQVGFRADYYLNFNKIAELPVHQGSGGSNISLNAFTVNLMVCYRIPSR